MSDERFLKRWSRRKGEARANDLAQATGEVAAAQTEPLPRPEAGAAEQPELDLSSLPPIDSINALTDITAFLRKGVPADLTRAALRRAWSSDPAIRDFIGPAENAWDFTDPNAMPGFGPLDCSEAELSAWVDRIVGGVRNALDDLPGESSPPAETAGSEPSGSNHVVESDATAALAGAPTNHSTPPDVQRAVVAVQPSEQATQPEQNSLPRRTHGGALPR